MRTVNRIFALVAVVALAGMLGAGAASAQLANASAATLGVGTTATARHYSAIANNPAGLGMPGAGFSLSLFPVTVRQGLGPVTLKDLKDVEGTVVSSTVKENWLSQVSAQGHQAGSVGAAVTAVALTVGRIGFQVSTIGGGNMSMTPDVMEVALFGNAGRTGSATDLSLSGSSLDGFGVTTAGLAFGIPLTTESGAMALGATLKYSVGHVVAVGREQGGSLESNPIRVNVNFPTVMVEDDDYDPNNGSGIGLDVGFQMERDRMHFGATVQNLFNTFAWDEDRLVYRPGTALLEQGNNNTDFDKQSYGAAPAALKAAVDDMAFDPIVAVGAAFDVRPDVTVSGDIRNRFGDGMSITPKFHAGVGAEYRGLGALHVRGGGAVVTDGFQLAGGASLLMGTVDLSLAGALVTGDLEDVSVLQLTLSFGGR